MKKIGFAVLFIVLIPTLLLANDKEMEEEDFISIYVQLSIAAEQYLAQPDSLSIIQDSIFTTSGFTNDDFNDFRTKIDKNPEQWSDIWQKIVDRISAITEADSSGSREEPENE